MQNQTTITLPFFSTENFLECASGPVIIPLTNDYLFRALLQLNNTVLKYLISALLCIPLSEILSVEILNPIVLGQAYDEKDFYLDIRVCLNNKTIINLEMQVINEHNWPERSLSYLCRSFDNLSKGAEYFEIMPAIQIGLLDFTLFPEYPEFYATYKMLNIKNHHVYSDKFRLSVLDLTHIDLATEEDKQFGLHLWATLFKATTWEDIIMLAEQNEYIRSAADTIYKLTQEEQIRLQCEAREDYFRRQRYTQLRIEHTEEKLALAKERLSNTEKQLSNAEKQLSNAEEKLSNTEEKLSNTEEKLSNTEEKLSNTEEKLSNAEEKLSNTEEKLSNTEEKLATSEAENAELRARIAQLEATIQK